MTTGPQPLLKVRDVKKYFPIKSGLLRKTMANVKAVEGVSIDVLEGETLGVVGESGCGKSTFGRTILGLESLTEGTIQFKGQEIGGLTDRKLKKFKKEMQMIFQDPYASLNPRQRIGDSLEEAYRTHTSLKKSSVEEESERIIKGSWFES